MASETQNHPIDNDWLFKHLPIVRAKDFDPGNATKLLLAIQKLLVMSFDLMNHRIAMEARIQATAASTWLWNHATATSICCPGSSVRENTPEEEKKCEDSAYFNRSGGEMDGILDSMNYVLEVAEGKQTRNYQIAKDLNEESNHNKHQTAVAEEQTAAEEQSKTLGNSALSSTWNLHGLAASLADDLMLGSMLPSQTIEQPQSNLLCGVSLTDIPDSNSLFHSISDFMGESTMMCTPSMVSSGDPLTAEPMEARLQHLSDIEQVAKACNYQIVELDAILDIQKASDMKARVPKPECLSTDSIAFNYILAARDKLIEYVACIERIFRDELKCMFNDLSIAGTSQAPSIEKNTQIVAESEAARENIGAAQFEYLQTFFNSYAYNITFQEYLLAESDQKLKRMLLDTMHSSRLLTCFGKSCDDRVRNYVGQELSASICRIFLESLTGKSPRHRISEWGAHLLAKHMRALHGYVYEFCQGTLPKEKGEELLRHINKSAHTLDSTPPIDTGWERLFSTLKILKLKRLANFKSSKLHTKFSKEDLKQILMLRVDFDDNAINNLTNAVAKRNRRSRAG